MLRGFNYFLHLNDIFMYLIVLLFRWTDLKLHSEIIDFMKLYSKIYVGLEVKNFQSVA